MKKYFCLIIFIFLFMFGCGRNTDSVDDVKTFQGDIIMDWNDIELEDSFLNGELGSYFNGNNYQIIWEGDFDRNGNADYFAAEMLDGLEKCFSKAVMMNSDGSIIFEFDREVGFFNETETIYDFGRIGILNEDILGIYFIFPEGNEFYESQGSLLGNGKEVFYDSIFFKFIPISKDKNLVPGYYSVLIEVFEDRELNYEWHMHAVFSNDEYYLELSNEYEEFQENRQLGMVTNFSEYLEMISNSSD